MKNQSLWSTALLLILALLVIPVLAFYFDEPLSALQKTTLYQLLKVYVSAAILCFVVSTLTHNVSQVDKLWSVMPIIYAWIIAVAAHFEPRIVLMAGLISIWGLRLTYNFGRRGGYSWKIWSGEEDYRWAVLRAKPEFQAPWKWFLFNLFFISFYQMGLILLMTLPMVKSVGGAALGWGDGILTLLFLLFIGIETVADQQQWDYQKEKYRRLAAREPLQGIYAKGFVHTGLWGKSRHPNYAAEQATWILIYGFSVVATGHWVNWSGVGCLLLMLLFKSSSDFSESISAEKYPEYEQYQKTVPRFFPTFK